MYPYLSIYPSVTSATFPVLDVQPIATGSVFHYPHLVICEYYLGCV